MMMSVLMPEHMSTMAPAARRDRAETSLGRKPKLSPLSDTASLGTFDIMAGVTCFQLPLGVIKEAIGRVLSTLCLRRWMIRLAKASRGHRRGSPKG